MSNLYEKYSFRPTPLHATTLCRRHCPGCCPELDCPPDQCLLSAEADVRPPRRKSGFDPEEPFREAAHRPWGNGVTTASECIKTAKFLIGTFATPRVVTRSGQKRRCEGDSRMAKLIPFIAVYSSLVGLIYVVAGRLQDVLSDNTTSLIREKLIAPRLSYITQNWFIIVTSTIDRVLGFKQRHSIWFPRIFYSFIYSGCYVLLISIILFPYNVAPFWDATFKERLLAASIWYFFITPPLFLSCAFIDVISFSRNSYSTLFSSI